MVLAAEGVGALALGAVVDGGLRSYRTSGLESEGSDSFLIEVGVMWGGLRCVWVCVEGGDEEG